MSALCIVPHVRDGSADSGLAPGPHLAMSDSALGLLHKRRNTSAECEAAARGLSTACAHLFAVADNVLSLRAVHLLRPATLHMIHGLVCQDDCGCVGLQDSERPIRPAILAVARSATQQVHLHTSCSDIWGMQDVMVVTGFRDMCSLACSSFGLISASICTSHTQ